MSDRVETPPAPGGVEEIILPNFPSGVNELDARDKAAVNFAIWILALCSVVTIGLGIHWYLHIPATPALNGALEANKALIDQARMQSDLAFEQVGKIFDLFIAKAFLPIFATIIGYLLGKRGGT